MAVIHQLSPHVADLIAAGEVVERPGSVAKELLENAVDAGAKRVTVEIQNGGMTFLRVTDDGCGMAPDDAETAFLRHATSKIRDAGDLASITTLGFRGEALAAIASVSRIDLLTRPAGAEAGTSLRLEAGVVLERGPAGCPEGTTIIVRDLFYNTPARMKFMRSDAAEGSNVFAVVQRQALCHPEVAIRFLKDGQEQLSTPGDGQLQSAIYCTLGRQFALDLVEVESRWERLKLHGFVTKPTATRGNRAYQHFFVGGRPVRSKLLTSALEEAYRNQMMTGRFPGCVLCLDIPPELMDVNVHPAKTEVKFLSERDVFDTVRYGVLGALNRTPGRPEMQLKAPPGAPPAQSGSTAPAAKKDFYQSMDAAQFRAFAATLRDGPKPSPQAARRAPAPDRNGPPLQSPARSENLLRSPVLDLGAGPVKEAAAPDTPVSAPVKAQKTPAASAPSEEAAGQARLPMPEVPDWRVIGEALDTYLIVEQGRELLFIDKHAAHERILFERLRASQEDIMSQVLLAPLPVHLGREEAVAALENAALLETCGFELQDFGGGAIVLRRIPAELDESQAELALQELAAQLLEGRHKDPASLRDGLLHTIACKAAIKAGWHTEPLERDDLVRQVLSREDIKYCPHGRPVCITLTEKQLERQFKRS